MCTISTAWELAGHSAQACSPQSSDCSCSCCCSLPHPPRCMLRLSCVFKCRRALIQRFCALNVTKSPGPQTPSQCTARVGYQVDFAFSYSSIEHNGLGRYGDPLDPNADLHDMEMLSCIIRPGGARLGHVVLAQIDDTGPCSP